ncbi:MAG: hypothetical protein WBD11_04525 [Xanthobacteraceae bacterium]|jgi:hypothetical protein
MGVTTMRGISETHFEARRGSSADMTAGFAITASPALSDREAVADIFAFCNIEYGRQGTIDMNNTTVGFDIAEEDILTYEVSDEAIESAACSLRDKPGSATISFCSGLDSCPS